MLVDVDQADRVDIGAVVRERELQFLALGLDVLGVDSEGTENGQVDDADVRAGAGDDDHLVQGGEGEGAGRASEEGQLGRDEIEKGPVGAVLFAFLADD